MIRVVIVDDDNLVREGFGLLLERVADIEVVGMARDGREAIAVVEELKPDIVTMDIQMPHLNGFRATEQIRLRRANTGVVMVSGTVDEDSIRRALQSEAKGYVAKREAYEELVPAIWAVYKGKNYFSTSVSNLINEMAQNTSLKSPKNAYPFDSI